MAAKEEIHVKKEAQGSIWVIEFDRPPANTLTSQLLERLHYLVEDFAESESAKALIITGGGKRFFVGGADPDEIASIRSPDHGYLLAKKGQDVCNAIDALDKPVIAAINGRCIGGGNELALACHIRIASERAVFQQPEVSLGIIPAFGATQRLPRLIGPGRARKLILTGEALGAETALAWGLVDELVSTDQVLGRALAIAITIANKSQVAVRYAQQAIRFSRDAGLEKGLLFELECFKDVCERDEMAEALAAFREHRQPVFRK